MSYNNWETISTTSTGTSRLDWPSDDKYQDLINEGQSALGKVQVDDVWWKIISSETENVLNLVSKRSSLDDIRKGLDDLCLAANGPYGALTENRMGEVVSMVLKDMTTTEAKVELRDRLQCSLSWAKIAIDCRNVIAFKTKLRSVCSFFEFHDQIINVLAMVLSEIKKSDQSLFENYEMFWDIMHELTVVVNNGVVMDEVTSSEFAVVVSPLQYFMIMAPNKRKPVE
uniref:Uncharacterized protein n=1 Tax=Spongospora subterranea TaxID=70186 RepID=A0A0H5QVM5_9EUKA|eukprot:CRZ05965.1 hypothetical protein [Spongospora subterranea]